MSEETAAHINTIATQLAIAVGRVPSDSEIQTLSSLLIAVASDKVRAAQIQERIRLDNGLRTLVESLASTEVRTQGVLVNFGDGNKTGDITIGDFVGGDKITISLTLNVPEQTYLTGGLLNPFLGLRPFTYADRAAYGGQVTSTARAVAKLTTPGEERVVLWITGASGSGKSSFAQASVVPALEQFYQQRNVLLRHAVMRPSRRPLAQLRDVLRQLAIPFIEGLDRNAFSTALRNHTGMQQINVIIIDQFEEIFSQALPEEGTIFLDWLANLPEFDTFRTHIVITMRSDYLPDLFERSELYTLAKAGLELRAMSEPELQQAIVQPVLAHPDPQVRARQFEPTLLQKLAKDTAADTSYLPLLQITLEDLWQRGQLKLGAYQSLSDAISERADIVLHTTVDGASRTQVEQRQIMSILLDLVEVSTPDDAKRDRRRRRTLADLADGDDQRIKFIYELVTARLVSMSVERREREAIEVVDLIHETLMSNWRSLRDAIAEQRERLMLRTRFEGAIHDWEASGRKNAHLLSGARLIEARQLEAQGDVALRNTSAKSFLSESVRRHHLRRNGVIALVGVALVLVIGVAVATQQYFAQARISDSQRIAALAQEQLSIDPSSALLLAYEAVAHDANQITRDALRQALVQPQIRTVMHGQEPFYRATYSPDGNRIVTASNDGTAVVWDATSGAQLGILVGNHGSIKGVAYSPDGTHIATGADDYTATIWSALDGRALTTLVGHSSYVNYVAYSPDGTRLITASADGTAIIWDTTSGAEVMTLRGHSEDVNRAVYSPDGQYIITASRDETAIVWDATSGTNIMTLAGHNGNVMSASFSPDSARAITTSDDGKAIIWSTKDWRQIITLTTVNLDAPEQAPAWLWDASFSPDGTQVATTSDDGRVIIWDVASGERLSTLTGHTDTVFSITYSPDGRFLVTASKDKTVNIWDTRSKAILTVSRSHTQAIRGAAYNPDGDRFVTISDDGTAIIWDAISGARLITLQSRDPLMSAAYSPDGTHVVTASDYGAIYIWDIATRQISRTLTGTTEVIPGHQADASYSPDGKYVAGGWGNRDGRGELTIWEAATEVKQRTMIGHDGDIESVSYSPDGNRIVTASADHTAIVWNVATGAKLTTLTGHRDIVFQARFSPDGKRIVTASSDGTAVVWDAATGSPIITLTDPGSFVYSASFSPDGRRIVTASSNKTAIIWDAISGTRLTTLMGHQDFVWNAIFSPNGKRVLTVSLDRTAIQYLANDDELVHLAQCQISRELTPEEVSRFNLPLPLAFSLTSRQCGTQ